MDHLTFALYDVPNTSAGRIRLAATFPAGVRSALREAQAQKDAVRAYELVYAALGA